MSFDVQQDLAATPHADSVTWVSSVSTLLSSDTFSNALVSAVPSALSVSAATALVKNNQGVSPAPTPVAQGPDRGGQNEAGVVGGEEPVIGPPIEKPEAASGSGALVGFIIAGVGAILVLAGGGLAYKRFRKRGRPPPHPENAQRTLVNSQSSAVGKSGGPRGSEEGPVSSVDFESQLDFMLGTSDGVSWSNDSTANDGLWANPLASSDLERLAEIDSPQEIIERGHNQSRIRMRLMSSMDRTPPMKRGDIQEAELRELAAEFPATSFI